MLKIGEFSKLSRISIRMLRHYDEIGLLKPAEIDRFTDYRYYREDQLPKAGRIAALKDMGFSLADIVRILEVYDDREQLEQFFFCPTERTGSPLSGYGAQADASGRSPEKAEKGRKHEL